jgi:hypothetical protein
MGRRTILPIALLVLSVAFALGFRHSTLETFVPAGGSVGAGQIADGALDESRLFDRGFVPDTATICIVFDDGFASVYDSMLYWNTQGIYFGLGIIAGTCDTATVGGPRLTEAQVRTLAANGNEILNHGYKSVKGSALSAEKQEIEINRAYEWLTDTLGVTVKGYSYPYGDYNDTYWLAVAKNHEYGTGLTSAMNILYEQDSSLAYPVDNRWWRFTGSVCAYVDTLKWGAGPTTEYGRGLVYPGAVPNQWLIPVVSSSGPDSGDGTCDYYEQAKCLVKLVERNGAAGGFYFHKWDLQACPYITDFMKLVKAECAAGRLRVRSQAWIAENYVLRQPASGVNLFPAPSLTTSLVDRAAGAAKKPDGFQMWLWHTGTPVWILRSDSAGFQGSTNYAKIRPLTSDALTFTRYVPGDCYVTASFKANAFGAFATATDSLMIRTAFAVKQPIWTGNATQVPGAADGYRSIYQTNVLAKGIDAGGFPDQPSAITNAGGYLMQARYLNGDARTWKEIRLTHYVGDPAIVTWVITFSTSPIFAASPAGIKMDDVSFVIVRRDKTPAR